MIGHISKAENNNKKYFLSYNERVPTSSGDLVGNCVCGKNASLVGMEDGSDDETADISDVKEAVVEFSAANVVVVVKFPATNVTAKDPCVAVVFPASSPPSPDPECLRCLKTKSSSILSTHPPPDHIQPHHRTTLVIILPHYVYPSYLHHAHHRTD